MMSAGSNNTTTNLSTFGWDDLDCVWPDQTPFDVVTWYGVLLIVLYSLVFAACVIGKSLSKSLVKSADMLTKARGVRFTCLQAKQSGT